VRWCRVGLVVSERAAYPSDLTDEQWALIEPFLAAWKARHPWVSGHEGRVGHLLLRPVARLLDSVLAHTPTVTKAWVDSGFKDDVVIHGRPAGNPQLSEAP
jgi:hypothetical protein